MELPITFQSQRKEQATDTRGLPAGYARALTALRSNCAHCSQRAVVANGAGVGLCATHQGIVLDGIRQRERLRRAIDMAKAELR